MTAIPFSVRSGLDSGEAEFLGSPEASPIPRTSDSSSRLQDLNDRAKFSTDPMRTEGQVGEHEKPRPATEANFNHVMASKHAPPRTFGDRDFAKALDPSPGYATTIPNRVVESRPKDWLSPNSEDGMALPWITNGSEIRSNRYNRLPNPSARFLLPFNQKGSLPAVLLSRLEG